MKYYVHYKGEKYSRAAYSRLSDAIKRATGMLNVNPHAQIEIQNDSGCIVWSNALS